MTDKPTGVFVRLPLSDAEKMALTSGVKWGGNIEAGILAIGTPVTHEELYPVGYINEDAIGGLATGVYQSASIFRDEDKEHHDTAALIRLDVAQAKLAERDAEIARLREYYEANEAFEATPYWALNDSIRNRLKTARKALKGSEA